MITPLFFWNLIDYAFKKGYMFGKIGVGSEEEILSKFRHELIDNIDTYYETLIKLDSLIGDDIRSGKIELADTDTLCKQIHEVEGIEVDSLPDSSDLYLPYFINKRMDSNKTVNDLKDKIKDHCVISELYLSMFYHNA